MKRPSTPALQRGVAVITALLLTTLAITIVASLFWQQQVQVRSMENQRLHLQTKWILRAGLDLSNLILREDLNRPGPGDLDTLDDFWAVPLEQVRLDEFVENGRKDTETSDATLSGFVTDAMSMYNLSNLEIAGKIDPVEVAVFKRLLANLKLDSSLAQPAADAIAKADPILNNGRPDEMTFIQIEDLLSIPGFTPKIIDRLKAYAIFLPKPTPVNVYTASAEVLSARISGLSLSDATTLVGNRKRWFYKTPQDFVANLPIKVTAPLGNKIDVKSDFFIVNGKVRLNRASLDMQALVIRTGAGRNGIAGKANTNVIWIREN